MNDEFTIKEKYGITRFIALEYAAKYGGYALMRVYLDDNNIPSMVTSEKTKLTIPNTKTALIPAKLLILYCLYNEFNLKDHLGLVIQITRILERKSDVTYAERIGIDVSNYRLLENQTIENKGLISHSNGIRKYHITKETILKKLNINIKELEIRIEDYYE